MPKICVRMRDLPARTIVAAVADAAQRWADADFPPRVRATAAVAARTGYSEPVVDYALDRLFIPLTAAALTETIEAEIGSLNALDGFVVQRGKGARHAKGVGAYASFPAARRSASHCCPPSSRSARSARSR